MANKIGTQNGRAFIHTDIHNLNAKAQHSYNVLSALIQHGNQIYKKPYVYGGSHGDYQYTKLNKAYDCSSSIAYVTYKAGLKSQWHGGLPANPISTTFSSFGGAGKGANYKDAGVVIYYKASHIFMELWWFGTHIRWDHPISKESGESRTCWSPKAGSQCYYYTTQTNTYRQYRTRHVTGLGLG
jgi:hypothetical protein